MLNNLTIIKHMSVEQYSIIRMSKKFFFIE